MSPSLKDWPFLTGKLILEGQALLQQQTERSSLVFYVNSLCLVVPDLTLGFYNSVHLHLSSTELGNSGKQIEVT